MLCLSRSLLAALAVSYLMCLLLLSGIQIDDLDANMLNKLQRYNVNTDDLNNNELLHECTTFQFLNNKNNLPHNIETKKNIEKFIPKIKDQNSEENYNLTNVIVQKYDKVNKEPFQEDRNNHEIQYIDGQPELQSILKFWKDIKISNPIATTDTPTKSNTVNKILDEHIKPEQKNKRDIPDASNSNESDALKRLIMKFLLKKQNINVDKDVIKKSIDDLYFSDREYENKNKAYSDNDESASISPINVEATQNEKYYRNNVHRENKIHFKIPNTNFVTEEAINSNNFNDILNSLKHFKMYNPITPKDKSIESLNRNNKERLTSIENLYFNKFAKRENIFTTEKVITSTIADQKLSQNIIKEIANTVKELVLKDLRREIFATTVYPTTAIFLQTVPVTTKRGEIISRINRGNQNTEESILNKFMDLFEEIKTLNRKTLIISSEIRKESAIDEKVTHPVIPRPMFNMEQPNYYKTGQYLNTKSQKIFDYSPQIHKFRSNVVSESVIQVVKPLPITVQTNNLEIPPIAIPVDKPENPINQNIIVSTITPYRIGNNVNYNKIKQSYSRSGEVYTPNQPEIRFVNSQGPSHYYSDHQDDKRYSLKQQHPNYNTNFNDKITLSKYKESGQRGDEIKHPDISRFHEKLEKGTDYFDNSRNPSVSPRKEYSDRVDCCNERYAYSKQMVECCNHKVASRQQMSLSNMKKQPSYDDTHFKNFLKSQQKVTDMLERILASRSRVRSVETA